MTPAEKSELTRFIADKCMMWKIFRSGRGSTIGCEDYDGPKERDRILATTHPWETVEWNPTESISDAWMAVDRMRELGWLYALRLSGAGEVWAQFWRNGTDPHTTMQSGDAIAETAPLAICLAIKSALEGK